MPTPSCRLAPSGGGGAAPCRTRMAADNWGLNAKDSAPANTPSRVKCPRAGAAKVPTITHTGDVRCEMREARGVRPMRHEVRASKLIARIVEDVFTQGLA